MDFLSLNGLEIMTPLAVDTLQTGLIIMLLVLSCALTIYNLPWTHTELTETHRQTRTYFQHIKLILREYISVPNQQAFISGTVTQHGHRLNSIETRLGDAQKRP